MKSFSWHSLYRWYQVLSCISSRKSFDGDERKRVRSEGVIELVSAFSRGLGTRRVGLIRPIIRENELSLEGGFLIVHTVFYKYNWLLYGIVCVFTGSVAAGSVTGWRPQSGIGCVGTHGGSRIVVASFTTSTTSSKSSSLAKVVIGFACITKMQL